MNLQNKERKDFIMKTYIINKIKPPIRPGLQIRLGLILFR